MSKMAVHFSHSKTDWVTPDEFFRKVNKIYRFNLDAAADADNAQCARFHTKENCGLKASWANARVWINPPYGREIGLWTAKASKEAKSAQLIVMLVPARTDTGWWHEAIKTARPVFLRGRLKFKDAPATAPFPSALLIWDNIA